MASRNIRGTARKILKLIGAGALTLAELQTKTKGIPYHTVYRAVKRLIDRKYVAVPKPSTEPTTYKLTAAGKKFTVTVEKEG